VFRHCERTLRSNPLHGAEIASSGLDTPEEHGLLDPPRNDGQQKGIQMLTRISSNGQLTIPKSIRDALQFKSGDQFQARVEDGKIILSASRMNLIPSLKRHANRRRRRE